MRKPSIPLCKMHLIKIHSLTQLMASVTILGSTLILSSCQTSPADPVAGKAEVAIKDSSWTGSMAELKQTISELLPVVVDRSEYNSPKQQTFIQSKITNLVELSKNLKGHQSIASRDPSVRFISRAFTEDLERVNESFASGKKEYARYSLMNVTSYCIECHTRTSTGPTFNTPKLEQALQGIGGIERGEFLVATRDFDKALSEFKKFIAESLKTKQDLFLVDKAVRYALAVTVKFQQDPKKALEFIELIGNSKDVPFYLRANASGWKTSIEAWMKEKKDLKNFSSKELLRKSQDLVDHANKVTAGMIDRSGDIYFLRALSVLHLALAQDLKKEELGQALYLAGVSYEAVRDLSLWNLHENFYESCVRSVEHTEWSRKCFKRLEESIYLGYSGSSGTHIPVDVKVRLDELGKLAL